MRRALAAFAVAALVLTGCGESEPTASQGTVSESPEPSESPAASPSQEPALEAIEVAKANGSWDRLSAVDAGTVPDDLLAALDSGQLGWYVCDFPSGKILRHAKVVALPHLGASTREAEENCAIMVADQLRDFLEHGNVANAVNFPQVSMARESRFRVAIANANVPNMLGQISTAMANAGLNIHNMVNKSRGDMAYTLVDAEAKKVRPELDESIPEQALEHQDRNETHRRSDEPEQVHLRFLAMARRNPASAGRGTSGYRLRQNDLRHGVAATPHPPPGGKGPAKRPRVSPAPLAGHFRRYPPPGAAAASSTSTPPHRRSSPHRRT